MSRDIVVAGVGMTRFGKFVDRSIASLAAEAIEAALSDAMTDADAVDAVVYSNAAAGIITGQEMIRGQCALRDAPALLGKPVYNVENACASGSTAFNLACALIQAGRAEVALVVGAEKLSHADKARTFSAFEAGVDVEHSPFPDAASDQSVFMDLYAQMSREYMARSGATAEDFAAIAVKSHANAGLNPLAQYRDPVTVEQVLASRVITDPLRVLMCSPIGDGAAALVIASEAGLARMGATPSVHVKASVVLSGNDNGSNIVTVAARQAFGMAGITSDQVDVVELHDAAAPAEFIAFEELELCDPGQAPELFRAGHTAIGGACCVNPSGGLLSKGHPIGATGCAQLVELTHQLRGTAGERQSGTPKIAVAENAGGWLGNGPAATAVTVLGA
ncbi:thiolase family protein [Conexibacter sp. W3-3-2]|uniref:thiolase family protein n=1 Tax=Conexibacter sp. W3-3-2 TaxID=2675227 RepID=UPI0012B8E8A4|nr:thiolase family protein [Conexibacter sp. W3-3-2]MTD43739.1 thiolase family protein [Conexibacter sp. W3-3-2]